MTPTLPLTGASARTTTYGSKITRTALRWAACRPSRASRTTASGSLMSFFICPPLLGPAFDPARYRTGRGRAERIFPYGAMSRWRPAKAAGQSGVRSGVALHRLAVLRQPALVRPRGRVHGQALVPRRAFLPTPGAPRAPPDPAHLSHLFRAVRRGAGGDRGPEAPLALAPPREEPPSDPLRPV